ncbi:hypothetical protein ABZW44_09490 [Streptomyces mirabilis]|uniref:hypothetical protein n=1 Tax=Streptomyces mirabilis TaxID=68239 RepID=UPI0033B1A6F5
MYALIVPTSTPFVLLATVTGLPWWEDHVLPSAEPVDVPAVPVEAPAEALSTPTASAQHPELTRVDMTLTKEGARR